MDFHLSIQLILLSIAIFPSLCYDTPRAQDLQAVPKYPDCYVLNPKLIGDGRCDNFLPYNTDDCGEDGGDCLSFNENFPGCEAPITELVGDGICQNVHPYNTEKCDNDGGDCDEFRSIYPECYVMQTNWIGNGQCQDFRPYNSEACGYDGDDCLDTGKKKDQSVRNMIILHGIVVVCVIIVAVATWAGKRVRGRRTRTLLGAISSKTVDSQNRGKYNDFKSRGKNDIENIDVIDLSGERAFEKEEIDIEMPLEMEEESGAIDMIDSWIEVPAELYETSDIDDIEDGGDPDANVQIDELNGDVENNGENLPPDTEMLVEEAKQESATEPATGDNDPQDLHSKISAEERRVGQEDEASANEGAIGVEDEDYGGDPDAIAQTCQSKATFPGIELPPGLKKESNIFDLMTNSWVEMNAALKELEVSDIDTLEDGDSLDEWSDSLLGDIDDYENKLLERSASGQASVDENLQDSRVVDEDSKDTPESPTYRYLSNMIAKNKERLLQVKNSGPPSLSIEQQIIDDEKLPAEEEAIGGSNEEESEDLDTTLSDIEEAIDGSDEEESEDLDTTLSNIEEAIGGSDEEESEDLDTTLSKIEEAIGGSDEEESEDLDTTLSNIVEAIGGSNGNGDKEGDDTITTKLREEEASNTNMYDAVNIEDGVADTCNIVENKEECNATSGDTLGQRRLGISENASLDESALDAIEEPVKIAAVKAETFATDPNVIASPSHRLLSSMIERNKERLRLFQNRRSFPTSIEEKRETNEKLITEEEAIGVSNDEEEEDLDTTSLRKENTIGVSNEEEGEDLLDKTSLRKEEAIAVSNDEEDLDTTSLRKENTIGASNEEESEDLLDKTSLGKEEAIGVSNEEEGEDLLDTKSLRKEEASGDLNPCNIVENKEERKANSEDALGQRYLEVIEFARKEGSNSDTIEVPTRMTDLTLTYASESTHSILSSGGVMRMIDRNKKRLRKMRKRNVSSASIEQQQIDHDEKLSAEEEAIGGSNEKESEDIDTKLPAEKEAIADSDEEDDVEMDTTPLSKEEPFGDSDDKEGEAKDITLPSKEEATVGNKGDKEGEDIGTTRPIKKEASDTVNIEDGEVDTCNNVENKEEQKANSGETFGISEFVSLLDESDSDSTEGSAIMSAVSEEETFASDSTRATSNIQFTQVDESPSYKLLSSLIDRNKKRLLMLQESRRSFNASLEQQSASLEQQSDNTNSGTMQQAVDESSHGNEESSSSSDFEF
jgi:hypothetical protein